MWGKNIKGIKDRQMNKGSIGNRTRRTNPLKIQAKRGEWGVRTLEKGE